MFGSKREPETQIVDYENAKARDEGVTTMAKRGYTVVSVVPYAGKFKKGKILLTGGIGAFLLPGGARRAERYTVTLTKTK
jgi:hypothetical protein